MFRFDENWDKIKDRYIKWWRKENTDRPLFYIGLPKDRSNGYGTFFKDLNEQWLDIDKILQWNAACFENSTFIAETFPSSSAFLGPGSLALFLGSDPIFQNDTVWFTHHFDELTDAEIEFDKSSRWWDWTLRFTDESLKHGDGKYITEVPDLIENADILASLVGSQNLLLAMYDHPERVHHLQKQIMKAWFYAYDELYLKVRDRSGAMSFCDFGTWAPGKCSKIQCDFSAMISADMFGEFILPYIRSQADYLDYSTYHLDGKNSLQHLDHILSVESIKAVQWQPGSENPSAIEPIWYDLQKKISDSGKLLVVFIKPRPENLRQKLKDFTRHIGHKGIIFNIDPYFLDIGSLGKIVDDSYDW